MSYRKVFKALKKSEKLEKGSFQRRYRFNPTNVPQQEKDTIEGWVGLSPDKEKREKMPPMHPNARKRALNKLMAKTKTRRHPETGEVEFLLHRGMGQEEYSKFDKKTHFYNTEGKSSWTPHLDTAKDIARDQQEWYDDKGNTYSYGQKANLVSAWVPEKDIHHIPKQTIGEDYGNEHEVVVNQSRPHEKHTFKMNKSEKDLATPASSVKLNPDHGKMIADAYEQMPHQPNHPETQKAYGALINETKKQFNDMMSSGMKISRIQPGQENPYKNSKELHHDIKNNNHMHFFPTEQGFGSDGSDKSDHPMMQGTGIMHDGKELLANDLFRVVHDYYGHHKGGESGFGPKGEHRAYNTHKKMFSPLAQKALATETLGQNSYVNFGPHGEHNRANPHETKYAEQKAGLLPDHIISGNWHSEE